MGVSLNGGSFFEGSYHFGSILGAPGSSFGFLALGGPKALSLRTAAGGEEARARQSLVLGIPQDMVL